LFIFTKKKRLTDLIDFTNKILLNNWLLFILERMTAKIKWLAEITATVVKISMMKITLNAIVMDKKKEISVVGRRGICKWYSKLLIL